MERPKAKINKQLNPPGNNKIILKKINRFFDANGKIDKTYTAV